MSGQGWAHSGPWLILTAPFTMKIIKSLLPRNPLRSLSSLSPLSFLKCFPHFCFKVLKLHLNLLFTPSPSSAHCPPTTTPSSCCLSLHCHLSKSIISLLTHPNSYCDFDPIPTTLLKNISDNNTNHYLYCQSLSPDNFSHRGQIFVCHSPPHAVVSRQRNLIKLSPYLQSLCHLENNCACIQNMYYRSFSV